MKSKIIITIVYVSILTTLLVLKPEVDTNKYETIITENSIENFANAYKDVNTFNIKKDEEEQRKKQLVYEDMNMEQLVMQLNKSLNSTIANKGSLIASHSLSLGVDPFVAEAIMLEETGCSWGCSYLVKTCNNVGGVKGTPSCSGGYKGYPTIDEGIKQFIDNLYYNFYAYGLNTPEKMNSKYAENSSWAANVNRYVQQIKNR